ncbi:hypothetical protein V8G54_018156 [Vigna mungo]|uniref:Uncharacterized protein n=1 Tax=Vigna mungo TaxID=3915 RepID=A0AAQ3N9F9_VIGMU
MQLKVGLQPCVSNFGLDTSIKIKTNCILSNSITHTVLLLYLIHFFTHHTRFMPPNLPSPQASLKLMKLKSTSEKSKCQTIFFLKSKTIFKAITKTPFFSLIGNIRSPKGKEEMKTPGHSITLPHHINEA